MAYVSVAHIEIDWLAGTHVPLFLTMAQTRFRGDVAARIHVAVKRHDGRDAVLVPITFLGAAP